MFWSLLLDLSKIMGLSWSKSCISWFWCQTKDFYGCCLLCIYKIILKTASLSFSSAVCWFQTETCSFCQIKCSRCCWISENELYYMKNIPRRRKVETALLGQLGQCFLLVNLFIASHWRGSLLSDDVRASHFRTSKMVNLVFSKANIFQHFKGLLTAVAWHKSEILQEQALPLV